MENFSEIMSDRLMDFAVGVIKIENELNKTYSGRHVYGQLFRAASSAGANFEESRAAESRADFIHKKQIVLKELRESNFWIRLIRRAFLIPSKTEIIDILNNQSLELIKITSKSIATCKSSQINRT